MLRKYKTLTKSSPEKQNSGSGSGSGLISLCNQDIHVKSQSIRTPALDQTPKGSHVEEFSIEAQPIEEELEDKSEEETTVKDNNETGES